MKTAGLYLEAFITGLEMRMFSCLFLIDNRMHLCVSLPSGMKRLSFYCAMF